MNAILDNETPDLVVLNGDLITGENTFLENSTAYVDELVAPFVERGLMWASAYGNHDSEFNLSRQAIFEREHNWPNSRTGWSVFGREAGVSNYYLPVYASAGKDSEGDEESMVPEAIIWFFDSRGGHYFQELDADGNQVAQPDWVDESVVQWFTETKAELMEKHGKVIPSIAFVHIPINASLTAQLEIGINPNLEPGINDDYPLAQQAQYWNVDGTYNLTSPYGGQDVPFMKALTETPGLIALFAGHDHGDSWCYK